MIFNYLNSNYEFLVVLEFILELILSNYPDMEVLL